MDENIYKKKKQFLKNTKNIYCFYCEVINQTIWQPCVQSMFLSFSRTLKMSAIIHNLFQEFL